MPIYEYEHDGVRGAGCEVGFEVLQSMSEPALERCPTCGNPCHRVISCCASMTQTESSKMSPKNLERLGFTQYKRAGDGRYEKTCGEGPRVIKGD